MENKQTPVEFLIKNLKNVLPKSQFNDVVIQDIFDQSKVMDKEQKKLMFDCGRQYQLTGEGTFTQVYNEIYGK
jgi:hypothetical protein